MMESQSRKEGSGQKCQENIQSFRGPEIFVKPPQGKNEVPKAGCDSEQTSEGRKIKWTRLISLTMFTS